VKSSPNFQSEELIEFRTEATELLDGAEKALLSLDHGESFKAHYDSIFRCFHTIKGVAGMLELSEIKDQMHALEGVLVQFKDQDGMPKQEVDLLLRGIDATRVMLEGGKAEFSEVSPGTKSPEPISENLLAEFLVESRELLESARSEMEKIATGSHSSQTLDSLFRSLHSLKGMAFLLGRNDLGHLAHQLESCFEQFRTGAAIAAGEVSSLERGMDLIEKMVGAIQAREVRSFENELGELLPVLQRISTHPAIPAVGAPTSHSTSNSTSEKPDSTSTILVAVGLLDRLMNLMGEMVLVRNQLLQYSNRHEDLEFLNLTQQLNAVTSEIQSEMMKTRMQPIGNVLSRFERMVRDLARELGKKIELQIQGAETELDKSLLEAVKDPLTHIVRNCCDHGIETPAARQAAGKNEAGTILIRSYHEGGQVIVEISDDGRGLDRARITAKAIEKGLLTSEKAAVMSDREAYELIFAPGFSTAQSITNVSGRGVGMDVVRTNIEGIGGTVEISSRPGNGMQIKLRIPLTLTIVPALIIRCAGDRYAVPLVKVVELVRVEKGASGPRVESLQGKPILRLREKLIPLVDLSGVLQSVRRARDFEAEQAVNIVILNSERQEFGLIIDEVVDTAASSDHRSPTGPRLCQRSDQSAGRDLDCDWLARALRNGRAVRAEGPDDGGVPGGWQYFSGTESRGNLKSGRMIQWQELARWWHFQEYRVRQRLS
jgi:two-component system chemotaxis sensor kinase CheA